MPGTNETARTADVVRCLLAIAGGLLLSSCAILSQRSVTGAFAGLDDVLARSAQTNATLRLLVVHGMGEHVPGYADELMQGLAPELGLRPLTNSLRTVTIVKDEFTNGWIRVEEFLDRSKATRLKLYELTWSPTVAGLKAQAFALDETLGDKRLYVNRALKSGLIDGSVSDAILYTGQYKENMQYPIMRTVDLITQESPGAADELVVITHSLGSRMTFDTLNRMLDGDAILGEKKYNTAAAQALIRRTTSVYMLANQLPLLGLADAEKPVGVPPQVVHRSLKKFIKGRASLGGATAAHPLGTALLPLHIIAFSDPNDLLSYPLNDSDVVDDVGPGRPAAEISNVRISIARAAWFGVLANPSQAHTGYFTNRGVLHLIAHGYHQPAGPSGSATANERE